jgi:Ca2+-binding RTX toxin-like protein
MDSIIRRLDEAVNTAAGNYNITEDHLLRLYLLGDFETTGELGGYGEILYENFLQPIGDLNLTKTQLGQALLNIMDAPDFDAHAQLKNLLSGTNEGDTATGNDLDNLILTFGGNDTIYASEGKDIIDGAEGADNINYQSFSQAINIDLGIGQTLINSGASEGLSIKDIFVDIEHVIGTNIGNDTITGDAENNILNGLGGNDIIDGDAGDDLLLGGAGNDTYVFSETYGDDVIEDADSTGSIIIDGLALSGLAEATGEGLWSLTDTHGRQFTLRAEGTDARLTQPNASGAVVGNSLHYVNIGLTFTQPHAVIL